MTQPIDRRLFLGGSAAGLGYFFSAEAFSAARAADKPNEKIQFAGIGIGGKGSSDIDNAGNLGEIVALCDIDEKQLDSKSKKFTNAKKFFDFRKMLDEMGKQIDAVTVSTPDHTHAIAAVAAMRMKKHVYVQKPLTHSVFEARIMRETAKKYGVCTQMGNQGTASNGLRKAVEFIQAGGIGNVSQVHVWTNRPIWPQAPGVMARPKGEFKIPETVHWDEFLGPAPERAYAPGYHPFAWRGWWDFGTGALGDMACHTGNMAFMGLKLAYPTSVEAEAGDVNPETCPSWAHVTIQFPSRGDTMPAVAWNWYEGKKEGKNILPPESLVKGAGEKDKGFSVFFKDGKWNFKNGKNVKNVTSGSFLIGDKGVLFSPDDYGSDSYIVTADGVERLTGDPEKLPKNGKGDQGQKDEWVAAIRANKPELALSNFDYAGMLTETVLLGNVAIRAGKKLDWDGPHMKVSNSKEAQELIMGTYRKGWELTAEV